MTKRDELLKELELREKIQEDFNEERYFYHRKRKKKKGKSKRKEYLIAILVNLLLYYVVNHILGWGIDFITLDFVKVLPIINLSIQVTIFGNLIFLLFDKGNFYTYIDILLHLFFIAATYNLYKIYPFSFSMVGIDKGIHLGLIAAIVVTAAMAFYDLLPLIFEKKRE